MKTNNNTQTTVSAPVQAPTKSKVQLAFEENDQGRIAKIVEVVTSRTGTESSIRFDLEQRSEQWLKWRRSGVTATEAVVLLNGSHFGRTPSDVFDEKFGVAKPQFFNNAMKNGVSHESDCIKCFEAKHGVTVQTVGTCMANKSLPLLKASLDGYIPEYNILIECKCPGRANWEDVVRNGVNAKCVKYYTLQVQHQLLVSGSLIGYLCFWYKEDPENTAEAPQFLEIRIERDLAVMGEIIRKCGDFWVNNVMQNRRPEPKVEPKVAVVEPKVAAVEDISEPKIEETIPFNVSAIMEKMAELKEEEADIKAAIKEVEAKLKEAIKATGVNRLVVTGVGSYLLTEKKTASQFDYAAFFKAKGIEPTQEDLETFRTEEKVVKSYRFTPSKKEKVA